MSSGARNSSGNPGGVGRPVGALGGTPLAVVVNGQPRTFPAGTTVEGVVASVAKSSSGIAVALNGGVVPRSAWTDTSLAEDDQVEILTAAQGG